ESTVVAGQFALALQHVDRDGRLVVGGGGEGLPLVDGDGRIALDQLRADAAESFNAERKRSDIEQEHVLDVAGEHAALNRGAKGDHFVRVHAAVRFLLKD